MVGLTTYSASNLVKPKFESSLEALRGAAAVLVVLFHAITSGPSPDPRYKLSGVWQYQAPGHLSVIVFFMLSGYVIGLANNTPITTNAARLIYLKKRFLRLYPLYLVALLATVGVAALYGTYYTLGELGAFLLFLQNLAVKVPEYNGPLWSLSCEIVYYLLFLVVSARQWRVEWVIGFLIILGVVLTKWHIQPVVLVAYTYGAVFWFIGLFLTARPTSEQLPQYGTMVAFLLLLLSFGRMNICLSVLYALSLDVAQAEAPLYYDRMIVFSDLSYLVLCVPLLLCFANRRLAGRRLLELLAFASPALYTVVYILSGKIKQPELFNSFISSSILYILAAVFYLFRHKANALATKILQKLVPLGSLSYGIYIIHFPILYLFYKAQFFSGSLSTFLIRLGLFGFVVVIMSWLLEWKLQPWVKTRIMGKQYPDENKIRVVRSVIGTRIP